MARQQVSITRRPTSVLVAWSSGKDCAWALHELQKKSDIRVAGLLSMIYEEPAEHVVMHEVPNALLKAQSGAVGLPVREMPISRGCEKDEYEARWDRVLQEVRAAGIDAIAFGDLLIDEVKEYREALVARSGMASLFPLWRRPTKALAVEMLAGKLKATVVCVDTQSLPHTCLGRPYDEAFLGSLPPNVDPCGENGEFHTFVHDGPMFRNPVSFRLGEKRTHGRYASIELHE